ncbi:MAG: tagaturonate reductase [Segetibacter sp.]|nr:tagaturonate reductase [Segetibacter sp.]
MILSKNNLKNIKAAGVPENIFTLPEKVLQFGTGVLLRGLPDYFIDKANKKGIFSGRVVIVKSTSAGGTDAFTEQDGLFTQCIRGIENGQKVEENIVNASISRVISAKEQWQEALDCASNPEMEVVISNTTEVGIALVETDKITDAPPSSFPGKLLAFLHKRYQAFNGDASKGMVIVPTELIVDNGIKLKNIVLQLAQINSLEGDFIQWLENSNYFCSSLVDRIVPGKLSADEKAALENELGYTDELMIMSESYSLWAIEAPNEIVAEKLSFAKADSGVVIAPNINKFRELKLRLLNGTHTFSCGLAHLSGYTFVKEAMKDETFVSFVKNIQLQEIAPAIAEGDVTYEMAAEFAGKVIDRFKNPDLEHKWLAITLQYSGKMKMRNIPLIVKHYEKNSTAPELMALGFAAYIQFMKVKEVDGAFWGTFNGHDYSVQDDNANWFANHANNTDNASLVKAVLSNVSYWETDLSILPGFGEAVTAKLDLLNSGEIKEAIKETNTQKV